MIAIIGADLRDLLRTRWLIILIAIVQAILLAIGIFSEGVALERRAAATLLMGGLAPGPHARCTGVGTRS